MKIVKHGLSGLLLFALVAGCAESSAPTSAGDGSGVESAETTKTQPDASGEAQPDSDSTDQEIPLKIANWDEVQEMVAAHKGKVVVVDLWSTSCIPCIREFPNLVALHEQYPEEVACMSVSVDYTGAEEEPSETLRERVRTFLKKRNATFQNVICSVPDVELYDRIDLGAVPAVFVYDRQGELRKRFDNDEGEYGEEGFTYEDHIIPLVEELIEE